MTVTIRIPRKTTRGGSPGSRGRKPSLRDKAKTSKHEQGRRPRSPIEKLLLSLFLALPLITLVQTLLARTNEYRVAREMPAETVISGPRWSFAVPFPVAHKAEIERLIQCESGGRNISKPDSDGIISDGVLQFHRGPADTLSSSTWEDFSRASGLGGSPKNPLDAIRMTDWALGHGLGPRWTCWRQQGLFAGW